MKRRIAPSFELYAMYPIRLPIPVTDIINFSPPNVWLSIAYHLFIHSFLYVLLSLLSSRLSIDLSDSTLTSLATTLLAPISTDPPE